MDESRRCTARSKRSGERCKRAAIVGGTVCAFHGASAPQVKAKAAERAALDKVKAELVHMGVPVEVDPGEALVAMVRESAGNVAFLRARIQQLTPDLDDPDEIERHTDYTEQGAVDRVRDRENMGGIAGRVDPRNWRAERHVLVAMYDDERDRLAKYSKMALDAGVDERRLRLAEAQANEAAELLRGVFSDARVIAAVRSGDSSSVSEVGLAVFAERAKALEAGG